MEGKSAILSKLEERELQLPALVSRAVVANDRAKYLFTLLQSAVRHADHPDEPPLDLRRERQQCGLFDVGLDAVAGQASRAGDGLYEVPCADRIHAQVAEAVAEMQAAVDAASGSADPCGARAARLLESLAPSDPAHVTAAYVERMTSGARSAGDSLHLVVMDLHRRLHEVQQRLDTGGVEGARTYGLDEGAVALVRAFMAGVNRTAMLRLDHPGLGTTATQVGARVTLENDIGTTDAHVLIVRVEGLEATVVATDPHLERLAFFRSMLEPFEVRWNTPETRRAEEFEDGVFHLVTGVHLAADRPGLERYLEHLGSRLVFLIDWNKARKRLRKLVKGADAVALLRWAADRDLGHMAFLSLGGERLVFDALERLPNVAMRYGEELHEVLGRERAIAFLRFVLQRCSEGLRQGRSGFLIRDEIRAEAMSLLATAQQSVMDLTADHAALVVELASTARDGLQRFPGEGEDDLVRAAERAATWEHRADEVLDQARVLARRWTGALPLERVLVEADDVADHLEDVTFLLTLLLPAPPRREELASLAELAELTLAAAKEQLKAVEAARALQHGLAREDLQEFLEAVDQVVILEHRTDEANRRAKRQILTSCCRAQHVEILSDLRRHLEAASDVMGHVALALRAFVMGELAVR